ncbi:MAG: alpha/beta hydrolase [Candidatus Caldatribacteriaceae bacterium]
MIIRSSVVLILFFLLFSYISFENAQDYFSAKVKERFSFSYWENERIKGKLCDYFDLPRPKKEGKEVFMPPEILAQYAQGILYRNIRYGSKKSQLLDVMVPLSIHKEEKLPVFVFVHGGTWIGGSKDEILYAQLGKEITKNRYIFVSVDYRVYPEVSISGMTQDLVDALDWIKKHAEEYGGNPEKIVLGGHSAGAHLVALLTVEEGILPSYLYQSIQKVVLLSGPYDLLAYRGNLDLPWEKAIELLFFKLFEGKKNLRHFSPVHRARKTTFQFFLMVGEKDELTPPSQTERLCQVLRNQGNWVECHLVPGKGHGGVLLALNSDFEKDFPQYLERFLKY